jgi:phosphoribosylformylglycinamidine synthase
MGKGGRGASARVMKVNALIITGFGLNCERETAAAFELCGASASKIHLNDLLRNPDPLGGFHILAFIGGFSFGDHLGAGTVFANKVRHGLRPALTRFIESKRLVIGICRCTTARVTHGAWAAMASDKGQVWSRFAHSR